jgi:hypothetical protein
VSINYDCTAQTVAYTSSLFTGSSGATTRAMDLSGVGSFSAVYATNYLVPLTTYGATTTYQVEALLWMPGQAPPVPTVPTVPALSQWGMILLAGLLAAAAALLLHRTTRRASATQR